MKGEVKITQGDQVIFKEDNLVVDGAGEIIADILTTPPHAPSYLLDTSSYVIQGFTFGKTSLGYKTNLHSYKKHNLLRDSETNQFWTLVGTGTYMDEYPDRFELFGNTVGAKVITPSLNSYLLSSLEGYPISFSFDVKYDTLNPIVSSDDGNFYTTVSGNVWGHSTVLNIQWDASGFATLVDKQYGYIKKIENDWYSVCLVPSSQTYTSPDLSYSITMAGDADGNSLISTGGRSGGLLMRNPSIFVGSVPINYYTASDEDGFTRSLDEEEFPLIGSSLPSPDSVFFLKGDGTLTSDTSAFNVITGYPENPHPKDTYLQSDATTSYEDNTWLELDATHNFNFAGFEGSVPPVSISNFVKDWTAGNDLSSQVVMSDLRWASGFAPSSVGSMTYYMTSAMSAYDDPMTSLAGSANCLNIHRAVDMLGYTRIAYPTGSTGGGTGVSHAYGADERVLVKYVPNDFSSTGEIQYEIDLAYDDRRWMDLMGGVFCIGLHALDIRKGPYSLDVDLDQPEFRLAAKKVFNFPITYLPDSGADPGAEDQQRLKITWTLKVHE